MLYLRKEFPEEIYSYDLAGLSFTPSSLLALFLC